jgi:DNA repair exonuclease SbcCD nuclease subunit
MSSLDKARKAGVTTILNSGDILDKNRQRTCNIRELKMIDRYLVDHNMTMYTITGNHDLDSPTWLETLFDREQGPGIVPVDNKMVMEPVSGYTIGGIPGHNATELKATLENTPAANLPDILLWHGGVDGFMGFSAYQVTARELMEAAPSIKFIALGDLHIHGYEDIDGRLIGYPGSTEMCSISEDPRKYMVVVEVDDDGCRKANDLVLDTVPVYKICFTTQEEADTMLQWKKSVQAEEFSLIHLTYTQDFVDTTRAFIAQIDEQKTVIRRKRLSTMVSKKSGEFDLSSTIKSPAELLPNFVDEMDNMTPFMYKLSDRNYDPRVVVEQLLYELAPAGMRNI